MANMLRHYNYTIEDGTWETSIEYETWEVSMEDGTW